MNDWESVTPYEVGDKYSHFEDDDTLCNRIVSFITRQPLPTKIVTYEAVAVSGQGLGPASGGIGDDDNACYGVEDKE